MKLTHNSQIRQVGQYPEFEQFKARLLRQSTSFGMISGTDNGYKDRNIRLGNQSATSQASSNSVVDQNPLGKRVRSFRLMVSVVAKLRNWLENQITKSAQRHQKRVDLETLLSLSDHHLRDIGVHRGDLEHLATTHGDLDSLKPDYALMTKSTRPDLKVVSGPSNEPLSADNVKRLDQAA